MGDAIKFSCEAIRTLFTSKTSSRWNCCSLHAPPSSDFYWENQYLSELPNVLIETTKKQSRLKRILTRQLYVVLTDLCSFTTVIKATRQVGSKSNNVPGRQIYVSLILDICSLVISIFRLSKIFHLMQKSTSKNLENILWFYNNITEQQQVVEMKIYRSE